MLAIDNSENNFEVKDNLLNIYEGNDNIDVEFEVKKFGEIFIEIGNIYCDYFKENGKSDERIKFKYEEGKVIEYNLNGVEEIKKMKNNEEMPIRKQEFKSFLIDCK